MKTILQILLLLLVFVSCKSEKQKQLEKEIIGEWNLVEKKDVEKQNNRTEEPPLQIFKILGGFIFKKNGTVIDKLGFFDVNEDKPRNEQRIRYVGDSTQYKIKDDSLKIFDPIRKSWSNYKIISLTTDTLILQSHKDFYIKYAKANYQLNSKEFYDKIIISSSGCYGTCPIMDIEFNSNGDVYYLGEDYNLINGAYISKIPKSEYKLIEKEFKKSNILSLECNYSAPITDLNTVTVTFVKNKKVVKTIFDYATQAPSEFIIAYRKAMYAYQKMKLKKLSPIVGFPNSTSFSISKRNKLLHVSQSEKFLLLNEIRNGRIVSKDITPKYKLTFYSEDDFEIKSVIYSDGRYFKSDKYTYDIGYNFMEQPQIDNQTEP
ncbi:DUF6438 domain-containing protein [Riemerella anatipestifer]|uniref:DUF6438 domain-containing protein n=1 Tax=Riemerella anatipestifer TaxID=34085 RepID=UPI001C88E1B0|nr:DUF6438 domain-containing protein [Riemerella anatipestifer]MRM82563.1 hypothetical protein [Riemerella anatipestifer]